MMQLLKETGFAIALFALIQLAFGLGGDTTADRLFAAMGFGIAYFVIGLAIRYFKNRKS